MLKGKVALITGAASGIGQSAAFVFAGYGAKLVLADIKGEEGEQVAERIRNEGGEALFVRADVTKAAEVEALIQKVVATYGRIDCAFNNAGTDGDLKPTHECTEEDWDRVLGVNLKGVWLCMKYEITQMLTQGGGAIVNNASVAGLVGMPGAPPYTASKHGVVGITRSAAVEYAKANIRINAVCPGAIQTPLLEAAFETKSVSRDQLMAMQPIGRLGKPQEVAEAAAWLCSDKASLMTGHAMGVDGGYSAI